MTWKEVKGYEDIYEVSDTGQIRRVGHRGHGIRLLRVLSQCVDKTTGYPCLGLSSGGKTRRFMVHILVANAFLGVRPPGCEINHKDGDKTNPRADNLEYLPLKQHRNIHPLRGGALLKGEEKIQHKLTEQAVRDIRTSRKTNRELASIYGVHHKAIWSIKHGYTWRHVL